MGEGGGREGERGEGEGGGGGGEGEGGEGGGRGEGGGKGGRGGGGLGGGGWGQDWQPGGRETGERVRRRHATRTALGRDRALRQLGQIRHRTMPRAMAIATAIAVSAALVNRLNGAVP